MFAVIQVGSSQFKVSEGDVISTQPLGKIKGEIVTFDKVLLFANDSDVRIGQPYLEDVSVTAEVIRERLDQKIISYKYRRRKNSARKKGHRQPLTDLSIKKINNGRMI